MSEKFLDQGRGLVLFFLFFGIFSPLSASFATSLLLPNPTSTPIPIEVQAKTLLSLEPAEKTEALMALFNEARNSCGPEFSKSPEDPMLVTELLLNGGTWTTDLARNSIQVMHVRTVANSVYQFFSQFTTSPNNSCSGTTLLLREVLKVQFQR